MSPCINRKCRSGMSGLSWLDGNGKCAACRPVPKGEPIAYLHQGREPLVPLRELAAIQREALAARPPVAVERPDPVPASGGTLETATEPLRAIKPPAITHHLDAQTAAEEMAGDGAAQDRRGLRPRHRGGAVKAIIRKVNGQWAVNRPAYGFAPGHQQAVYPTWKAAIRSLDTEVAGAGSSTDRASYTLGLWAWNRSRARRPGWISCEAGE